MTYAEWERTVPTSLTADALWKVRAYQLALYASHLAFEDAPLLLGDVRTKGITEQLLDAVRSIGASVAEGYSRRYKKEKLHLYDYALGSAREARVWYFQARPIFPSAENDARLDLLSQVVKLLTVMIARDRGKGDGRGSGTRE
jgi:four helix bundle protein